MNIKDLSKPLDIKYIDFRIQSIKQAKNNKVYASILAYKDARVDMIRLDEVVGALNWKREHTRDNKNCIVSIWDASTQQWVSKEDTGTESNTEKEKGLASDSFKRACFNWGIGRELYDYPSIFIELLTGEYYEQNGRLKQSTKLKLNNWKWSVEVIDGEVKSLIANDGKQNRFTFNKK